MSAQGIASRADDAVAYLSALAAEKNPGERLGTKGELQAASGVSKGTFNEALRLLAHRGTIRLRSGPGGGLFVSEPTPMARLGHSILTLDSDASNVGDAVRIRDALDPLLVADAVRHSSVADVEDLRACLGAMEAAVRGRDATGFLKANWALHRRIARITPNELLRSIYLNLLTLIDEHTLSVQGSRESSLDDYIADRLALHSDIVDAIDARDAARAATLMERHSTIAASS